MTPVTSPLTGVRVVELAGIGPAPFAGMLLADLGAEVVLVERPALDGRASDEGHLNVLARRKRTIACDLKDPAGIATVLDLVTDADVLIEGMRPGVAERLGVGPDDCWRHNPRLVYGRMTGWGQSGPLARTAGHDITYIAITGALHAIGAADGPPQIPLNLVGDFAGGSMYLTVGVLAALREVERSGCGVVVDASIVDGTVHLLAATHMLLQAGLWRDTRGVNLLDGGAPFYGVYATSDHKYVAVGAIEHRFYLQFLEGLGLEPEDETAQNDEETWPAKRKVFADVFMRQTRDEWAAVFEGSDACVAPVLSLLEAADHPQLQARESLVRRHGVLQPSPAPRFIRRGLR